MVSWNPKEKEEIEYRIKVVKEFLKLWERYDELFRHAYRAEPITSYLSDTVTLRGMVGIHFDFYKKLRMQWHATFLRLNEALGYLMTHLEMEMPLGN